MDSFLRFCAIGFFTLSAILGLATAAPDAAVLQFDPWHPATLLPVIAAGAHELFAPVHDWVDTTLAHLYDVLQRTKLRDVLPQ